MWLRVLFFALVAAGLQGCVAPVPGSEYADSITAFDKGFQSASDLLKTQGAQMDTAKQRLIIQGQFYKEEIRPSGPEDPYLAAFSAVVCSSSDYLKDQKNGIAELGVYDQVLDSINTTPKANLSALASAIKNDLKSPDPLRPPAQKAPSLNCSIQVANLLLLDPGQIPESAALLPALTAVQTLLTAADKVAVDVGTLAEDELRGRKLKLYIAGSKDEVTKALSVLNAPDPALGALCASLPAPQPGAYGAPCKGKDVTYTHWDGVAISTRWAALRSAWHLYGSLLQLDSKLKPKMAQGDPASEDMRKSAYSAALSSYYALLDRHLAELSSAIANYQLVANAPGPDAIAKSMTDAQATLLALADGKLTPAESAAILKNWAKQIEQIHTDLGAAQTAATALKTKM